jgi:hypothetical protein
LSAKRRRGLSPGRDFQRARSGANATRSVVQLRLGHHRLPPVNVDASDEAINLAVQRFIMILAAGGALRLAEEPGEPHAGRPRKPLLDAGAGCYEFDVAHFDWLRKAGWGNVPPDRVALDAVISLLFPSDDPTDDGLRLRRREQLKAAIKRRRAKRSSPSR